MNQHDSNMFAPRNVLSKKLKGDHYEIVKDLLSFVQDHFKDTYACLYRKDISYNEYGTIKKTISFDDLHMIGRIFM